MNRKTQRKIRPEVKLTGYVLMLAAAAVMNDRTPFPSEMAQTVFQAGHTESAQVRVIPAGAETIYYNVPLSFEQQDTVRASAEEFGVPFSLALAVIEVESSYNPDAVSSDGKSIGAMQIHEVNHKTLKKALGEDELSSLRANTRAGCFLLGAYLEKYGNESMALMAYNLGEGGAGKKWRQGVYETKYSAKVLKARDALEAVPAGVFTETMDKK